MPITYKKLKNRQRNERDLYPQNTSIRIHRSLSWLNAAEETDDIDSQFVFLWIAFNAAYANETSQVHINEREIFKQFIQRLVNLDQKQLLSKILWDEFPNSIRVLLKNKYIFQPFWNYHNGLTTGVDDKSWERKLDNDNKRMATAISRQDTSTSLNIIISRLYTMRNQILHGGATWNSGTNREQIRDCTAILGKVIPAIIQIMMDSPNEWAGDVCYPVVDM